MGERSDDADLEEEFNITFDIDGEPFLPPGPYHRKWERLRRLLAQFLRVHYGKSIYLTNVIIDF